MDQEIPTPTPGTDLSTSKSSTTNAIVIAGALLIGFAMIASALYFSRAPQNVTGVQGGAASSTAPHGKQNIRPVSASDHIQGNPNATIVFVEYSDYDCPFCRIFHDTMTKIMAQYGSTGQVAWVYREFPLPQLHPNAPKLALAGECAAALGGNDAFWKFTDALNNSRQISYNSSGQVTSVEPTNMTKLNDFATAAGLDLTKFNNCVDSQQYKSRVDADFNNGVAAGVTGTPHTFVLVGGQETEINGAQPYSVIKSFVDNVLKQIDGTSTSTATQ